MGKATLGAARRAWLAPTLFVALLGSSREGVCAVQSDARPRAREARSVAELAALPADTKALVVRGLGDPALPALARLRDLESLAIHGAIRVSVPGGARGSGVLTTSLTDAAFATIAGLSKLRRLCLDTHPALTGATLPELQRLPTLESLTLRYLDIPDPHLPALAQLPSLSDLDLSYNYGFRGDGLAAVAACRGLRRLVLHGCQQIHGADLVRLQEVHRLEVLDLSDMHGHRWRHDLDLLQAAGGEVATADRASGFTIVGLRPDSFLGKGDLIMKMTAENNVRRWEVERLRYRTSAQVAAQSPERQIDDATLAAFGEARALRELHLPGGSYTAAGLAYLRRTSLELLVVGSGLDAAMAASLPRTLRTLIVKGGIDDAGCAALRHGLPRLQHLEVSASGRLSTEGLAELVQIAPLRRLGIRGCTGLQPTAVGILRRAEKLEALDLRGIHWVVPEQVRYLQAARPSLAILLTGDDPGRSEWSFPSGGLRPR